MTQSLRKVIYWGTLLSVYALMMAVVIHLLNPDLKLVKSLSDADNSVVEGNDSPWPLIDLVSQSEELSGILLPLGPDEGHLPGDHAVWHEFQRALQSNKKSKTTDGFDGIQAVGDLRDLVVGAVAELFLSGNPRQVFHQGDLLYLLNDNQKMQIIDCKDPREPRLMALLPYEDIKHAEMLGSIAFLLLDRKDAPTERLLVVDLDNPERPRELARLELPEDAFSFFFINSQLVVYSSQRGYVGKNYVYLYSLDDRFQLSLLGSVKSPVLGGDFLQYGDYVLVPELHEGLSVYDFSDPLHFEQVSFLDDVRINRLARYGDLVFAIGPGGRLYTIDLHDPLQPTLSNVVKEADHAAFFVEHGNYTYFFTFNGYLRVFDFSALDFQVPDKMSGVVSGELMSLSPEEGFTLFGKPPVALPSAVVGGEVLTGSIEVVDHLLWKDSMVFLTSDGRLHFYREGGDSSPVFWHSLQLATHPQWLAAGDDHLYVGGKDSVSVVAVNVDGTASVLGQVDLPGKESWDGLVLQKTLFVAAGKDGLLTYSLQQPDAPVASSGWVAPLHLKLQIDVRQLAATDNGRVFFTAGHAGLFGGRVDAGGNFTLKGYFRFSDSVRAFAVHDGAALVSTEKSVYVVDIRDEYSFQNLGEIAFSGVSEIAVAPPNLWAGYSPLAGWSVLPLPRFLSTAERALPKNESKASLSGNSFKLHVFNDHDVKKVVGIVTLPGYLLDQSDAGGSIVH